MVDKTLMTKKVITNIFDVGSQLTSRSFAQLAIRLLFQSLKDTTPFVKSLDLGDEITVNADVNTVPDKQISDLINMMINRLGLKYYTKKIFSTLTPDEATYLRTIGVDV